MNIFETASLTRGGFFNFVQNNLNARRTGTLFTLLL